MGNFASSAICFRDDAIFTYRAEISHQEVRIEQKQSQEVSMKIPTNSRLTRFISDTLHSLKTTICCVYQDTAASLSGSSVVLSEIEEAWYLELVGEIDTICARCARCGGASASTAPATPKQEDQAAHFMGPDDSTAASVGSFKSWSKTTTNSTDDDDASSDTTEETDDESKCDYSDSDVEDADDNSSDSECEDAFHHSQDQVEGYYADDDDTETKADHLLRLSSMNSSLQLAPVYVDDYLCPCGECPQYQRIANDVHATVTWRGLKELSSIIRVLQAFSTYNEVIGYHREMIEAAEECLQVWLGDEDRALNSLVMLYDEVPQLCASQIV